MKIKGWIIFGCLLIIAGVSLSVYAFSKADYDLDKYLSEIQTETGYTEMEETYNFNNKIKVNSDIAEVNINIHSEDNILIKYSINDNFMYDSGIVNEILEIDLKQKNKFHWFSSWHRKIYINISVPERLFESFEVINTTGEVYLKNIKASYIKIDTTTGMVRIDHCTTINLDVKCTTGEVQLESVDVNYAIGIAATTGEIKMENVTAKIIKASCSTGELYLKNIECKDVIDLKATTGRIIIKETTVDSIKAVCSTGEIKIDKLTCPNIDLKSTTGSINGNINGIKADYKIIVEKTTGSSNINNTESGSKRLYVRVSTGDINIHWNN